MSEEQEEQVVKGPGQLLKEARERANLSIQDIADKVCLKKSLIEDIEGDNYELDISLTFLRGYIKLYAKQVQVSEVEVLAAFDNLNTQNKEPAKVKSFSRRVANQANDDKLMLLTYLVILVVIALVVIWWFQQDKDTSEPLTLPIQPSISQAEQQDPDALKTERTLNVENELDSNLENISDSVLNDNQLTVPQEAIEETTVNVIEKLESSTENIDVSKNEAVAPVELIFEFSGDCWMNLSDATGENIAYGVKVKGRVMPVSGIPPFTVTLGASEAVKISYAGEAVDLSFLTPGNIAKFNLPLSE
ncbi:RodZ domain-containing protein [uncultured Paraglaciecola sp.]|uniref:RodZ domain-containing protein n=1 Tax=uncultured Paraglaciecola sp. TaxID=1765024 RepID=UPI002597122A|nr:RodZ domain-containing protein [uncultured Paraglaciecola sp.]